MPERLRARRKPNAKGRSGRIDGKHVPLNSPMACGFNSFSWLPLEVIQSAAFAHLGKEATRFFLFLLMDHAQNGGVENGRLTATHAQLVAFGIGKNSVAKAIEEACALGLVAKTQQGGRYGLTNRPNQYRLTFMGWRDQNGQLRNPTNEWKAITDNSAEARRKATQKARRTAVSKKTRRSGKVVPLNRGSSHPHNWDQGSKWEGGDEEADPQ
ncbi:hypothetical protein NOG11_11470 [Parvularcula sp. BGMRC 0090]|uniref:Uncharacterized protein n=1 Tax=Parvularcula maris TaxID=2965077 RepID=A0A9X2LCK8_9PROT|nr:hypothetical protein [Parvularcula maris]